MSWVIAEIILKCICNCFILTPKTKRLKSINSLIIIFCALYECGQFVQPKMHQNKSFVFEIDDFNLPSF